MHNLITSFERFQRKEESEKWDTSPINFQKLQVYSWLSDNCEEARVTPLYQKSNRFIIVAFLGQCNGSVPNG